MYCDVHYIISYFYSEVEEGLTIEFEINRKSSKGQGATLDSMQRYDDYTQFEEEGWEEAFDDLNDKDSKEKNHLKLLRVIDRIKDRIPVTDGTPLNIMYLSILALWHGYRQFSISRQQEEPTGPIVATVTFVHIRVCVH